MASSSSNGHVSCLLKSQPTVFLSFDAPQHAHGLLSQILRRYSPDKTEITVWASMHLSLLPEQYSHFCLFFNIQCQQRQKVLLRCSFLSVSRLGERAPLATVVLACSAGWHHPTPRRASEHHRQGGLSPQRPYARYVVELLIHSDNLGACLPDYSLT
jgi:hypothetical protein